MMHNSKNVVLILTLILVKHKILGCKSSTKATEGGPKEATVPVFNHTLLTNQTIPNHIFFDLRTISNYSGKLFTSELWNKNEMHERIPLQSIYEITVSPYCNNTDYNLFYPMILKFTLQHINKRNQSTVLLELETRIDYQFSALKYVLNVSYPKNKSHFERDISQGGRRLDLELLQDDKKMTTFVLFDFESFNFFWCSSVGVHRKEILHCFLDRRVESLNGFTGLVDGSLLLSIENTGTPKECSGVIDEITVAHNAFTSTLKESSKNYPSNSTFAKEILKNKQMAKNLTNNSSNFFMRNYFPFVLCKQPSSVPCAFKRNKNLFCINNTLSCRDYEASSYYWEFSHGEALIDLTEMEVTSLKNVIVSCYGGAGQLQIIDGYQNIIGFVNVSTMFQENATGRNYSVLSSEFHGTFSSNVEDAKSPSIALIIELPENKDDMCLLKENARLYVAAKESRFVENLEFFGKINPSPRYWYGIKIIGFELGVKVKVETVISKHEQEANISSILVKDMSDRNNLEIECHRLTLNTKIKDTPYLNTHYSILIITIPAIIGFVLVLSMIILAYKLRRKPSPVHVDVSSSISFDPNSSRLNQVSKPCYNDYDDCIDIDAIEESVYATTEHPEGINHHLPSRSHLSNNPSENNGTTTYLDTHGESVYVMTEFYYEG